MGRREYLEEIRKRALEGLDRPSLYGPDIDLREVFSQERGGEVDIEKKMASIGLDPRLRGSGVYIQLDDAVKTYRSTHPGVEVYPIEEAVDSMWDEVRDYFWRLIDPSTDKYVAYTALRGRGGYFVRARRGSRTLLPVQTCLMSSGGAQLLHNIVVVEEGAELTVVSGCLAALERLMLHVGVSEIYLRPGSRLYFIMIHSWTHVSHVRPRTAVLLEDSSEYISYYINISEVRTLQMLPKIILRGAGARAASYSVILGSGDSRYDIGSHVVLEGEESSAQLVSRVVARDSSEVVTRLRAEASGRLSKAYIECSGLLMSDRARIETIPELDARNPETELFHEASIGRIRDDEIEYMMMKGVSYRDAVAMLVRGFIDVELRIPDQRMARYIDGVLDLFAKRSSV